MKIAHNARILYRFFVLTLAAAALSLAAPAQASAAEFNNTLTDRHVAVPGLSAAFIPARDLRLSDKFNGFISEARRIEVIVAELKAPYASIEAAFTDANLKTRGVELRSSGSMTLNGAPATLIKAQHRDGGNLWGKWILLAQNGDKTLVVNGVFVGGDEAAAKDVEAMLKSAVF